MTLTQINPMARLVFSGAIVFAVLAAVAGVSGALFTTNPATATANSMSTGNAELQIAHDNGTETPGPVEYGETITGFDPADGLVPGGPAQEFNFWLKNNSDASVDLNLFADLSGFTFFDNSGETPEDLGSGGGGTDIDANLEVGFSCASQGEPEVTGSTPTKTLLGTGGWSNAVAALGDQFVEAAVVLTPDDDIPGDGDDEAFCTMTVSLKEGAEDANHSATFDAVFKGQQVGTET